MPRARLEAATAGIRVSIRSPHRSEGRSGMSDEFQRLLIDSFNPLPPPE